MTVFLLIFALGFGFMPASSYAKNNDDKRDRDDRREERIENHKERSGRNDKSCLRAFGHLFAPGFIKNRGRVSLLGYCFLPFGISKKFSGMASSTLDTTAPVITNLRVKPNTTKARISWRTDEKSDSTVFWSTSANINVNSSSTLSTTRSERTKEHEVTIENLSASTTYFIIVRSRDASSNVGTSVEISFQTKALTPDSTPPVISSIALLVGTSTINVSWETNEGASSRVYYGTSASLDVNATTTSFVGNATLTQSHILSVSGLSSSTLYYLAAESKDANGNRTVTPTFSATTASTTPI